MSEALALKYRPTDFSQVTEQNAVTCILMNQIETNTIKNGYLFAGPAGTGKTTSARIFANMINNGEGEPIELDAASNNSVDDIRRINEQAVNKPLVGKYKVFILDEVHMLSSSAWNAFLKTLEEPPTHAIFILCTTDPQKIPATILSRVQRYNMQKISTQGIAKRLHDIMCWEREENLFENRDYDYTFTNEAIEYIAKIADGCMRDGITLLDKCLSYSRELTIENVVKALGVADYDTMFKLNNAFFNKDREKLISIVNDIYSSGVDLKHFIKTYFDFILDINVWVITKDEKQVKLPSNCISEIKTYGQYEYDTCFRLMAFLVQLQNSIKYEHSPKPVIVAKFLLFGEIDDRAE